MNTQKGYCQIDRFRIIAALLVVAIHTSPLLTLGILPDYLFTRVLARIGVPFFQAVTGFFVLTPCLGGGNDTIKPVFRFMIKTSVLYGVSILLYLPVNIYAGHWHGVNSLWQVLKVILVDGTMYHLWYLPAVAFGVLFVWLLLRYTGLKAATGITMALYIIGLLGDSYFGIVSSVPWMDTLYRWIFTCCDYTRNGLFYAPIFLIMGVWAAKGEILWSRPKAFFAFFISLLLMLFEGTILHEANVQLHDSMYVMLPSCVLFLMLWLSSFSGTSDKRLRDISLIVYIVHPWAIIALRGAANVMGLAPLLIENSIVHYLTVSAISFAVAGVIVWMKSRLPIRLNCPKRAWIEVDLKAIEHNVKVLKSLLQDGCRLMPVIKGNAYGLGAVPIAKALYRLGIRNFCVATLAEGIKLRKRGVRGKILILGYTRPDDCHLVKRYRLIQTVVDVEHGVKLAEKGVKLSVHIKVDTGMNRLGERCDHAENLCKLFTVKTLHICGIFTQLSCCDSKDMGDIERTNMQITNFYHALDILEKRGVALPPVHIQCSYGIINYPNIKADYVRPGLALYGIVDEESCIGQVPDLKPVFKVKAQIALVKSVCAGENVGYGNAFISDRDMRVAVITIGYADGLPRSLSSGAGRVLVHGRGAPIIGNVCMDQTMVDVSDIAEVEAGEIVTVIGDCEGAEISVNELAESAGTIPNEIVSRFGERMERNYR